MSNCGEDRSLKMTGSTRGLATVDLLLFRCTNLMMVTAGRDRQAGLQSRFEPRSDRWRTPAEMRRTICCFPLRDACGVRENTCGVRVTINCCTYVCQKFLNEATLSKQKKRHQTYRFTL